MNKAVMLSIRPKWVEKIASGEKTIEVRKTWPNLPTPFKTYIYCSQDNDARRLHGSWGKVIGEFTCDRIDWITHIGYTGIPNLVETRICDAATMRTSPVGGLLNAACLTPKMLNDYLAWGNGYGWHISDLRIYDAPRELSKFERPYECNECDAKWATECNACHEEGKIKRPPPSWCYVEAMDNG